MWCDGWGMWVWYNRGDRVCGVMGVGQGKAEGVWYDEWGMWVWCDRSVNRRAPGETMPTVLLIGDFIYFFS